MHQSAVLSYHAMRLRWCALALRDFLRRWGAYVVVAAAVGGAGAVGWQQIIGALAAWLVLPLFYAAGQGAWLALALPLQAIFGVACVWAMRSLLWPQSWAESERALPLSPGVTRRSDALVVLMALLPLQLLQGAGAAVLLAQRPAWLQPVQGRAVVALLVSALLSVCGGVLLLQRLRRPPAAAHGGQSGTNSRSVRTQTWGVARVVVWLPLWRGPARRTGSTLAVGVPALLLPAAGLWSLRGSEPWFLAAFSLAGLWLATRVNHLARIELEGLVQAALSLPVNPTRLHRRRAALGPLAMLPGLLAVGLSVLLLRPPGLRPALLGAWALTCGASAVVEAVSTPADPAAKAARWLFCLILCICLASEVIA